MFERFQNFVPKIVNKNNLKKSIDASLICEVFRRVSPEIINNKEIIITPKYFKKNILFLDSPNSATSQTVFLYKTQLINAINQDLNKKVVNDIKFV